MGKNFSRNNASRKRRKSDAYSTPYSMTEQLLDTGHFDYKKTVLEPACGNLDITNVLQNKFNIVVNGDIQHFDNQDFLKSDYKTYALAKNPDYIITNPPFSLAYEFIQKSKEIAKDKFAMLLPLSYLHGQKRYEDKIFTDRDYPLSYIYVFTRYPLLTDTIRTDGKYSTGMMVYAWYIWDYSYLREPVIRWIDNQKYVLSKKDY